MNIRKNLTLSEKAIAVGEKLAAMHGTSLSALVEKQILSSGAELETEHYWREAAFIITRNERDFKRSPIPVPSPAAFLNRFH